MLYASRGDLADVLGNFRRNQSTLGCLPAGRVGPLAAGGTCSALVECHGKVPGRFPGGHGSGPASCPEGDTWAYILVWSRIAHPHPLTRGVSQNLGVGFDRNSQVLRFIQQRIIGMIPNLVRGCPGRCSVDLSWSDRSHPAWGGFQGVGVATPTTGVDLQCWSVSGAKSLRRS